VITISKGLLGGGKEGSAKLATVMSHEGTHAAGNRIEGMAHLQGNRTYNTINAVFGLTGDAEFSGQMISAILDPASWVENTGEVDRWEAIQTVSGAWGWLDNNSRDFDISKLLADPDAADKIKSQGLKDALLLSMREDRQGPAS
jgi:hypothetical protein